MLAVFANALIPYQKTSCISANVDLRLTWKEKQRPRLKYKNKCWKCCIPDNELPYIAWMHCPRFHASMKYSLPALQLVRILSDDRCFGAFKRSPFYLRTLDEIDVPELLAESPRRTKAAGRDDDEGQKSSTGDSGSTKSSVSTVSGMRASFAYSSDTLPKFPACLWEKPFVWLGTSPEFHLNLTESI